MSAQTLAWRRKRKARQHRPFSSAAGAMNALRRLRPITPLHAPNSVSRSYVMSAEAATEAAALICEEMASDSTLFLCERNKLLEAARRIREAG
tara:strand:- start:177 stop:455 length:279 start_codon:yes stop_codon:yes gene_type:complete